MEQVPGYGDSLQGKWEAEKFAKTLKVVDLAESSSGRKDLPLMVKRRGSRCINLLPAVCLFVSALSSLVTSSFLCLTVFGRTD